VRLVERLKEAFRQMAESLWDEGMQIEQDDSQDGRLTALLLFTKAAELFEEQMFRGDGPAGVRLREMQTELMMHKTTAFIKTRALLRTASALRDSRDFVVTTETSPPPGM